MERVLELAEMVASVDATVLISGESGTGKERIARRIHDRSPRTACALVAINCGALPEALLESELFGHIRGAFTGAVADKPGLFEAASGGTLFLDEVAEMSPATQVKLLRVLQEREVRRIGATSSVPVDVRVIAATNRDLDAMARAGSFRQDLFYRLQVVRIALLPLRERREDILPLARELLARTCASHRMPTKQLSPDVAGVFGLYAWPGNVRELENAIEHAVVLAGDAPRLEIEHLPAGLRGAGVPIAHLLDETMTLAELERRYTLLVLERHHGSRVRTAMALGIGTNTLWRRLKQWNIRGSKD